MNEPTTKKLFFQTAAEAAAAIDELGADERGTAILREKAVFRVVQIDNVPLKAAIILKQTFLANGGDVAVPRGVGALTAQTSSVICMGTLKQYRKCIAVLKAQPFGLKQIGELLAREIFD